MQQQNAAPRTEMKRPEAHHYTEVLSLSRRILNMHIAIDAHSIGTQAGGNETYFRQLLRGLASQKDDNRYTIFSVHQSARETVNSDPRFNFVSIPKNPFLRMGFSLPSKLRAIRPEVFHCQYIMPPFTKSKTVVTIHDLAHEHFPEFAHPLETLRMRKLVRWTARRADHVYTVSRFCAGDISRTYGVPPEKISFAYQAPSEQFRPRDKQAAQEHIARAYNVKGSFILYVGRVQARKNLPRLVEAYAFLRKRITAPKLLVVGKKDWQAEKLLTRITELGLKDCVRFTGYVEHEDLPFFYNAAELFVFPSIFEGFGLPLVESMASGTPTVTSYGSALEEIAADGALLADPLDANSIAEAMRRVLEDNHLRDDLIQRGLRRSQDFKPDELPAHALGIYRSLAGCEQ